MKQFGNYQYVGGEMTKRDRLEAGSKFWNRGKWDNFVAPFLPDNCSGMTLVDMGCNAGLFLKLAEEKGFNRVFGVDSNTEAIRRALHYRRRNGGKYHLVHMNMERVIDKLPLADYTVLANSHYYFQINDWLDYLDKLRIKSRHCIIVTAEKRPNFPRASADLKDIRSYFKNWDETGFVDELPLGGDPFPRRLWGFCFRSRFLERVDLDSLDCGNHVQDRFYEELDKGREPLKTRYGRILVRYRKHWLEGRLKVFLDDKVALYESVKKNRLLRPLVVNLAGRVLDGNHRCQMMRHLGYKSVIVRRV